MAYQLPKLSALSQREVFVNEMGHPVGELEVHEDVDESRQGLQTRQSFMDVICESHLAFLLVLLERDPHEPARQQRLEVSRPLDGVQQQLRVDLVLSSVIRG